MQLPNTIRSFFEFDWLTEREFALTLGHLGMLYFLFFGIYFYQERLLLIDTAYFSYTLLHTETFFIEHFRYINYFNQWLPVLLMKLGVGIKGVLISYSFGFVLFYYIIFNTVAYIFKNHKAALFMVVSLVLSSRFTHYFAVTETMSSFALSFLFMGWVTREKFIENTKDRKELLIGFCMLLLLQTGHPIIWLPVLSFTAFYIVFHDKWKDSSGWIIVGMVLLAMIIRFKVMPSSGYEQNKMGAISKAPETIKTLFDQWTYNHLKEYSWKHFKYGYILYLLSLGGLVYMRKYLAAFVTVATAIAFVVVVVAIYPKGEAISMLENYYIFFGFFWGFTIWAVFSHLKAPKWVKYIPVFLILVINFRSIHRHGNFFTERLEYLHELTLKSKEHNTSKLLWPKKSVKWNQVIVPWGVPFTTLIYSTLKDKNDSRTLYLYNPGDMKGINLEDEKLFLGAAFNKLQFKGSEIPNKYFSLPETKYYMVKPK